MKRWIIGVMMVALLGVPALAEEDYFDERHQVNLTIPNDWTIIDKPEDGLIDIVNDDQTATINVSVFSFSEPVTANGLQMMRMSSMYDGWINLGERLGTNKENMKANSDESYVSIYAKKVLDDYLRVQKVIVGEYYFVKGKKGYVISFRTKQKDWKDIQRAIKRVVTSFWIGKGRKPTVSERKLDDKSWKMTGVNSSNQNSLYTRVRFRPNMDKEWATYIDAAISPRMDFTKPVVTNDNVFLSVKNQIVSLGARRGQEEWKYRTQGSIDAPLAYDGGVLYFVVQGDTPSLYAVMTESGDILFKQALKTRSVSAPVVHKDKVVLVDGSQLRAFDRESGESIWGQGVISNDRDMYPVGYGPRVLMAQGASVESFNIANGARHWTKKVNGVIAFPPTVYQDMVIIPVEKGALGAEKRAGIEWRDVVSGDLRWEWELEDKDRVVMQPLAVIQDLTILSVQSVYNRGVINDVEIIAIDHSRKEVAWRTSVKSVRTNVAPIVTNKGVYLLREKMAESGDAIESSLVGLRLYSGKVYGELAVSQYLNDRSDTIVSARMVDESVVLQTQGDKIGVVYLE